MAGTKRKVATRKRERLPITGAFDRRLLANARAVANRYRIMLNPNEKLGFVGSAIELPTVFSSGSTPDQCVQATREALVVAVASLLEAGVRPPAPLGEHKRQEQMNIRLDAEEKFLLREAAVRSGFRSASDYVRAIALRDARRAS